MRASRLLTILMTLQLRGRTTAQALAERLEVSKRTIYRDIDELSAAGVGIYADRGRGGGIALVDGFRTELTGLTSAETEALLLAGLPAVAADLGLAGEASSARIKMLASLPRGSAVAADRIAHRFHLDPADWYRRPVTPIHLQAIARCVWEDRRLDVRYQSWKRSTWTTLNPWGVVLKAGRWYLVAEGGGKARIYRLDKVLEARPLQETFERPVDLEVAAAWRELVERFERDLLRQPAVVLVSPSADDRLHRLGDVVSDAILTAPVQADGRRRAKIMIEGIDHAAGLLLGFADEVEVIEPQALRDALSRRSAAIVALYGPKPAT
jgi:predicted DNA-binding transcriptional regulator YafY